uniref:Protein kinase domain-containing protein n=1 Tax=Panagrolaimus sp. ES5 TaxID=591445 RepID=A0AC34FN67_9BILA
MFSFSSSPPSIYDEPKKHEVKIEKHREPEKRIEMERDEYRDYVIKPLSKTFSRAPKHTRIFWENASREMMSSARLLPSIPPRENFAATQIIRKQFIQETDITPYRNNSTWWFYGQYNLFTQLWSSSQQKFLNGSTMIKQVLIREIDLTSCYFDERNAGVLKELYLLHFFEHENLLYALATESEPNLFQLYLLHFFEHENLFYAFATESEPNLFRMHIISPLSIPLPDLEVMSNLKHFWQRRPFYPYIPICILRALKYLHERGIVHKNVRTGACLFDSYGNVFLGAFHKIEISDQERRKSEDIWCLGTTILDQIFQRDHYYPTFPNPASVLPDQSLIET